MRRGNQNLIHEYNHFRAFGFTNEQIADRLGYVATGPMVERLRKLGVETDSAYEGWARKVLDRLIDSGEKFTSEALPTFLDPSVGPSLMAGAKHEGRVVKVGRVSTVQSGFHLVPLWQGVAA